tara:strand:+ start:245 stop:760 length:516 start_codon:yes stop_codon:yes gene_type:complete
LIKEVEQYIARNYYKLLKIAHKYTDNDDWASELLHEVVLQLYDKKEYNLKLDDESIKSYIIRCLMVNWCYPSSPFYKKYKKDNLTHVEMNDAIQVMKNETEMDEHKFMDIMEQEFQDQSWFHKLLFEKYLTMGSLKKVSIDTKISLPSIGRYIKETRTQVKLSTFKRYNNE